MGAYVGPKRIRQALEKLYGPTPLQRGELFDHILTGTVVTIATDGVHAAARSTQLGQLGQTGKGASWEIGVFENRFVKQDGKWKIAAVHFFQARQHRLRQGLGRRFTPGAGCRCQLPAGSAAFAELCRLSEMQSVGFSFANPVTGRPAGAPVGPVAAVALVSAQLAPVKADARVDAATIAELQRQLRVAIGVDATENQMSSYGYYIDESDWDSMADTYGVAGAKELSGVGVYVGGDRIRKALTLRGPKGGRNAATFTIHQVVQPVIHVAEE